MLPLCAFGRLCGVSNLCGAFPTEMHLLRISDIVSNERHLDQCVKAHMFVYIVLKFYVDAEEKSGLYGIWDGCGDASHIVP